ncbi:hypothetical protein BpHYR1_044124 [Brachionus plicatilis]|uniref:Uncharacterized protein n=1 Tax=Brachionus plicatilis TaxID=10195 RepID=A0A3M7SWD6_BRAPC|nr:hypothetical protein BpHYR1_044124 [Brachionus plicatilis]
MFPFMQNKNLWSKKSNSDNAFKAGLLINNQLHVTKVFQVQNAEEKVEQVLKKDQSWSSAIHFFNDHILRKLSNKSFQIIVFPNKGLAENGTEVHQKI